MYDKYQLNKIFSYNPEGYLVFKPRDMEIATLLNMSSVGLKQFNTRYANKIAGQQKVSSKDYKAIRLDGKFYPISRIVYIMHYGDIPDGYEIDHIDENKHNNRIENLRALSKSANNLARSLTRLCGVRLLSSNKYEASITLNSRSIYLGSFTDRWDAICSRKSAEIKIFRGISLEV